MKYRVFLAVAISLTASAQTVAFKLHNNYLIVVRCSVANMHDLAALVDTGASETAIDLRIAKRLQLPTTEDAATFGTLRAQTAAVSIPDLVVGDLHLARVGGIAIDGSAIERQLGVHIDLIIGMDVLKQRSLMIDYKAEKIAFGSAPQFAHAARLQRGNHLALVPVILGKTRLFLHVDTGLNGILVYGARIPVSELTLNSTAITPLGSEPIQMASVPLRVGDWEQRRATVAVTDDIPQEAPFDGLLGTRALGSRRLSFDWEKGMMSWE